MKSACVLGVVVTACGRYDFASSADAGDPCASIFPPISSLTDDFSDGSFAPSWTNGGTCMTETGGELVATPPVSSTSNSYCIAGTVAHYRLACDALTVHLPEVTTQTLGVQTAIYFSNTAHSVNVVLDNGGFVVTYDYLEAAQVFSNGYDTAADAWWRVRGEPGHVYLDTSPNAATWNQRVDLAVPFPLDDLGVTLAAGTYMPIANPGNARFRCFNLGPPCS